MSISSDQSRLSRHLESGIDPGNEVGTKTKSKANLWISELRAKDIAEDSSQISVVEAV